FFRDNTPDKYQVGSALRRRRTSAEHPRVVRIRDNDRPRLETSSNKLADRNASSTMDDCVLESLHQIKSSRLPAVGALMSNDNGFSQACGGPDRAQTQVVVPENIAPLD